ncbi:MAG: sensor histidine kinase, partial [Deltaproteobacteria bacterium]|nr:sensor histidine kinase [Deltaproteobacteria bacterium]
RLTVTFAVADEVLGADVPTFDLQPLVENTLEHGISRCPGPGTLTLSAGRDGPSPAIEAREEAPGAGAGPLPPSSGIGLSNAALERVRARRQTRHAGAALERRSSSS